VFSAHNIPLLELSSIINMSLEFPLQVHERDQDTDLALLIVKKFIHSVSPNVKVILMSATFDCQVFSEYFATAVRGEMQNAPIIDVEGKIHDVKQFYWSDSPLRQMVSVCVLLLIS